MPDNLITIDDDKFTEITVLNADNWVVVGLPNGKSAKISRDNLKAFLGTVQTIVPKAISIADPAPVIPGIYRPTASGTYANLGGLVIDTNGKMNEVLFDGVTFANVVTVLPPSENRINQWTAQIYTAGKQVLRNGIWWEAVVNTTAAQEPGVVAETIWKKVMKVSQTVAETVFPVSGVAVAKEIDSTKKGYKELVSTTSNFVIGSNGVISANAGWLLSNIIDVVSGDKIMYFGDSSSVSDLYAAVIGFNTINEKTVLLSGKFSDSGIEVTIPEGIVAIQSCSRIQTAIVPVFSIRKTVSLVSANAISGLSTEIQIKTNAVRNGFEDIVFSTTNNSISETGVITAAGTWRLSELIPVSLNDNYLYFGNSTPAGVGVAVVSYNSDGSFNGLILGKINSPNGTGFIISEGIGFIRVGSNQSTELKLRKVTQLIKTRAIENLGDAPAFEVLRNGFEAPALNSIASYLKNDGTTTGAGTWVTSGFIDVIEGEKWGYVGTTEISNVPTASAVIGFNQQNEFVSVIIFKANTIKGIEFIIPEGISKIRGCSHTSIQLQLKKIANLIQNTGVEGLVELEETVQVLVDNMPEGSVIVTNKSWAAIGDSITWQDGNAYASTTNIARGYQTLIREKFLFTSYLNRGFSGYPLSINEANSGILGTLAVLGAYDIYTLLIGTNDFKLNIPLGAESDYLNKTGGSTFYGALRDTVDTLYAKNNSTEIIFMTPLRRNNAGYTSFSENTLGHTLPDYCNAVRFVCTREALKIIDLFEYSGITEKNLMLKTLDGLHPNDSGYVLMSRPVIQVFKELFN